MSERGVKGERSERSQGKGGGAIEAKVLAWLLEEEQPAVRLRALLDLEDRKPEDPEVRATRERLGQVGWAADQLAKQGPQGFWEEREPQNAREWMDFLYMPPFVSTFWRGLLLSELGLDRTEPRIAKIAEQIFAYKLRLSSPINLYHEEACMSGNVARMLTAFGYGEDRRVRFLYDWLLEDQREDGGWNCSQDAPGTLDAWEPLDAFARVPKEKRSARMVRAIERGAEFYLGRKLMEEGERYEPWLRFHFPTHYYYDVLVGLDVLTQLGYSSDRRLGPALKLLRGQRQPDGTWRLDRSHPDLGPGIEIHPPAADTQPLLVETPGQASKWITLKALTVLKRVDGGL